MDIIDDIRELLATKYPDLPYTVTNHTIRVISPAPEGFNVSLQDPGREFIVGYGNGWHEHFTSQDEAFNCFAFGFSANCRLKITRRGRCAYKWTVEALEDGKWIEDSTTGTVPMMFWRPRRVEYRRNALSQGG